MGRTIDPVRGERQERRDALLVGAQQVALADQLGAEPPLDPHPADHQPAQHEHADPAAEAERSAARPAARLDQELRRRAVLDRLLAALGRDRIGQLGVLPQHMTDATTTMTRRWVPPLTLCQSSQAGTRSAVSAGQLGEGLGDHIGPLERGHVTGVLEHGEPPQLGSISAMRRACEGGVSRSSAPAITIVGHGEARQRVVQVHLGHRDPDVGADVRRAGDEHPLEERHLGG